MVQVFSDVLAGIKAKGNIEAFDVLNLRATTYQDGSASLDEAQAIMDLHKACTVFPQFWLDFYFESVVDFVVRQQDPMGYVDDYKANWLIGNISVGGRVNTPYDLELITRVIETADEAPSSLRNLALSEIEQTINSGQGATRDNAGKLSSHINTSEVAYLRRLMFSISSNGAATISDDEAETLFRLKNICLEGENANDWQDFFAKAIGNHLMAHNFHTKISAEKAQERETFLENTHTNIGSFLSRAFVGAKSPLGSANRNEIWGENHGADDIAANEKIDAVENSWLQRQITSDGITDKFEQAVLDFIKKP
jgi:hypothetical protein